MPLLEYVHIASSVVTAVAVVFGVLRVWYAFHDNPPHSHTETQGAKPGDAKTLTTDGIRYPRGMWPK